jgi:hypothetical protein
LGMFILCGGVGLFENMDIVAEGGTLVEQESLYHGAVDSDADVRADSLVNLACFAKGAPAGRVCGGTVRFGLLGLVACVGVVTRPDGVGLGGRATCSLEGLPNHISIVR